MQIIRSRALRLRWITLIAVSGCASELPSLPTGSTANTCGDGIVQVGEPCDDGNAVDTDACLSNCNLNACGDGEVHVGVEYCDDGNTIDQDECRNHCVWSVCGDGSIRLGLNPNEAGYEACDDNNTSNNDSCTNQCTEAACGDGYVQDGVETCDDGNLEVGDGCNAQCQMECGNGLLDPNEDCDDGNEDNGDGCPASCRLARCGDGYQRTDLGTNHVDAEACDDGNDSNRDGCLNDCTLARCGDGFARQDLSVGDDGFEECDDGNELNSDACPEGCLAARCGDGFERQGLEAGDIGYEQCDDGNDDNSDNCRSCRRPRCGDGYIDLADNEVCDGDPQCDPNTCQPLVSELVFGYDFGCAARSDGSVLCWPPDPPGTQADNRRAKGDGEPLESTVGVSSVPAVPLARLVASTEAICGISGGEDPTLSGKVYCWGNRYDNQLGRPVDLDNMQYIDPVAQPVSNSETAELQFSTPVRSVHAAAGGYGFCLIDAGQRIFCWGLDANFWMNFDSPNRGESPHLMFPEESGVKSLAISRSTVCFINADDRVFCMGESSDGKLGNNELEGDFQTEPEFVQGLPDAAALEIAASPRTFCVRSADQRVSCWGNNQWRQIGRFNRAAQATPYLQPNLDQVTALTMPYTASCALRLGRLYCWGVPTFGTENLYDPFVNREGTLPVHMEGLPEGVQVQTIHSGRAWVCARASNHRSYCWGNANEDGYRLFGTDQDVYTTAVELNPWSTPLPDQDPGAP